MKAHVSVITLGVEDVARAKQFYAEGLGWPIDQDFGQWVCFPLGDGSMGLGLYPIDSLAGDAGVADARAGFGGVTLSYLVGSEDRVAEVLAEAEKAGGTILKPAQKAQWGGADGYFSDLDGYVWKVAAGTTPSRYAAE